VRKAERAKLNGERGREREESTGRNARCQRRERERKGETEGCATLCPVGCKRNLLSGYAVPAVLTSTAGCDQACETRSTRKALLEIRLIALIVIRARLKFAPKRERERGLDAPQMHSLAPFSVRGCTSQDGPLARASSTQGMIVHNGLGGRNPP